MTEARRAVRQDGPPQYFAGAAFIGRAAAP